MFFSQEIVDLTSSNLTKFNTHMNSSLAHSNSELNTCCPHIKGSIKGKYFIQKLEEFE